jgi:hypothetical protein
MVLYQRLALGWEHCRYVLIIFLLSLISDIPAVLEICSLKGVPHTTERFMVSTMRTQTRITAYIERVLKILG